MKIEGNMKKKIEYFWMYYKFPALAAAAVAVILIYFVYAAATQKEPAFTAYLFDAHTDVGQDRIAEEFAEYADIDTKEYAVTVDTSFLLADSSVGNYTMTSLARFYTEIGTENLDACIMLEDNFMSYAQSDAFLDLRSCLSEELLTHYRESLVYVEDVPVGIRGDEMALVKETKSYEDETCVFGILYNSGHVENAVKFLNYCLDSGDKEDTKR